MARLIERPSASAADGAHSTPIRGRRSNAHALAARPAAHTSRALRRLARRSWRVAALPLLAGALFVAITLGAAIGAVTIPPLVSARILLNATQLFHFPATWPQSDTVILLQLRLPRVLGAALVGAALAISGALFQGLLRNPLADPLLLGTSSGAALGATVGFLLPITYTVTWFGFGVVPALAFGGALLAVGVVYALATRRGQTPIVTLLLVGVAVNAALTALQTLLVTLNPRLSLRVNGLYLWIVGAIDVQDWRQVGVVAALLGGGLLLALALAPALDAFALGEEMAGYVGLPVERAKVAVVAVAALLVAAAVSISGLVGFVGLVAPHLCRITLGPRNRLLLPAAALAGALFVVVSDLIGRVVVAPSELPLGVVTALVGAPFFLSLLRSAGRSYRW